MIIIYIYNNEWIKGESERERERESKTGESLKCILISQINKKYLKKCVGVCIIIIQVYYCTGTAGQADVLCVGSWRRYYWVLILTVFNLNFSFTFTKDFTHILYSNTINT